jgi:uncharacterized protein (TIGR03086 family)
MIAPNASPHAWAVLDRAHAALRTVVRGIPADAWQAATPCTAWTVTQVLQHAAGDQLAYAGVLTGTGFPEEDPFAPSGELSDDAATLLEPAMSASAAAFGPVSPEDPAVAVPLPQGSLPGPVAVGACALDAAVHAWDLAVATSQPSPLDDDLSAELLAVARQIVEPLRGFAYAAALAATPEGSTATQDLLRYLGRDPHWSPS